MVAEGKTRIVEEGVSGIDFVYDATTGRYYAPYNPAYKQIEALREKGLTGEGGAELGDEVRAFHGGRALRRHVLEDVELREVEQVADIADEQVGRQVFGAGKGWRAFKVGGRGVEAEIVVGEL